MSTHKFTLSYPRGQALPEAVEADGRAFCVNADFRVFLKIFRLFDDPEVKERDKRLLALAWFYREEVPPKGIELLYEFVSSDGEGGKRDFCWEFDAPEIYASFMQQYRIDLFDVDFLHWYKFRALFSGLGADTPFGRKVQLRNLDTKGLKNSAELERAKAAVQIPDRRSRTQDKQMDAIRQALMSGGDLSGLL